MKPSYIDVWDAATFDEELLDILTSGSDLIRDYVVTDNDIAVSHDLNDEREADLRPDNQFAADFYAFTESMIGVMEKRTVRAWHYTRLLDSEVEHMRSAGIHLSTVAALKAKLDALVSASVLSKSDAADLFVGSPMHSNQLKARSDKFWMTSHPVAVDDHGVVPLLSHWGGEVVTFWQNNPDLLHRLSSMGLPRVLEIAVPLSLTTKAFRAGEAVVATFGRTLGVFPERIDFDIHTTSPLPGDSVLRVHSEGDGAFRAIARGYPERYVEIDH